MDKDMSDVTVIKHGIRWINNSKTIQCPECNTSNIDNLSITVGHMQRELDKPESDRLYKANLICTLCLCEFSIKRIDVE